MKSNFKIHILVFFFSITVFLLIYPHIFYKYFVFQMPFSDQAPQSYFADWTVIISAMKCKLQGYDVFLDNPCDFWNRRHVYGSILLFLPYNTNLNNLYSIYIPIFFNLLFLYVVISHINFKKIEQVIIYILFIFSPATLLAVERFNIDILIFLILLLICHLRSNLFKSILIVIISLAKFYPVITSIIFLFKGINKKNLSYFLISVAFIALILFLDNDNLAKVFSNIGQATASHRLAFGIMHFSNFPTLNTKFPVEHLLIFSISLMSVVYFFSYLVLKKDKFLSNFNFEIYSDRLFFIGGVVCVSTYLLLSNYIYREIFIFLTLPFLLKTINQSHFAKFTILLIVIKLVLSPFTFYYIFSLNDDTLNIIKSILDNLIMSIMLASLVNIFFYKSKNLKFIK